MEVVAVVGIVVRQVVLQAGARGGRVTAAERNAIQQVTAVYITPDPTGNWRRKLFSDTIGLTFSSIHT